MQQKKSSVSDSGIKDQLKAMYADLLRGPRNISPLELDGYGANQPEGQRQLTDSIKALREKHVEFQVPAQHDLLKVSYSIILGLPELGKDMMWPRISVAT